MGLTELMVLHIALVGVVDISRAIRCSFQVKLSFFINLPFFLIFWPNGRGYPTGRDAFSQTKLRQSFLYVQVFSLATDKDFDFKLHFFLGVC
jgi:hypothetical protein